MCLLRGTDWIFKCNSVYVFCVDLSTNSDNFPTGGSLADLFLLSEEERVLRAVRVVILDLI